MKLRELKSLPQTETVNKNYFLLYARKSTDTEDRQLQSIDDQIKILTPLAKQRDFPILKIFQESKSAKAPNRPVFNEMIQMISDRQDIKGILCWNLSRLSRNPVDSGTIQWLIQQGVIDEVITPSRVYTEVDSDFVMSIEGAQANRFIRDLSKDVKRGMLSKVEKGQRPGLAPVGYLNNPLKVKGEKDVIPHPTYFKLMRKIFDYALTGNYTITDLIKIAEDIGVRTSRGDALSKTGMCNIIRNPFYAGKFLWLNQLCFGIHKQMITDEEFDRLQGIFDSPSKPRQKDNDALTGIIRCGECGSMITFERHKKKYKNGTEQIFKYYRCVKKNKERKCSQPFLSESEMEKQVVFFLKGLKIKKAFVNWAIHWLNEENKARQEERDAQYKVLKDSYERTVKKIDGLLELKISPLNKEGAVITDEEFIAKKQQLMSEKGKTHDQLSKVDRGIDEWTELAADTFDFATKASVKFKKAKSISAKKLILNAIGSNLLLKDKKLEIQPRTPFYLIQKANETLEKKNIRLEPKNNLLQQANPNDSLARTIWSG